MRAALFVAISVLSVSAHAFPELIRHGYVNCTTCHVSPSGGGALNDYGRTFSGEGLSSWSEKGEESLFHGLVKREQIPTWLSVGGDVRAVQTHEENSRVYQGQFIWMQADVEAAVKTQGLTLDLSLGRFQIAKEEPRLKSRRFFAMYNFTDEVSVRAGRFIPAYGINLPDHIIATRGNLNFDQSLERYNVEASWITESWSGVLTASKGPVELPTAQQENALTGQIAYAFLDTYKAGANVWSGSSDLTKRLLYGVFGTLGFTDRLYALTEFDWQPSTDRATDVNTAGFFSYNRLGYELVHGLDVLLTGEYWQTNLDDGTTTTDRYGAGFEFFPRPHFELQAFWTKQRTHSGDMEFEDYAWAMLHYYF